MSTGPDAVEVVRALGGEALRAQILRHTTLHSLRTAVAAGRLRRVSRGAYALPESPPSWKAALALRGVVSHASAAAHWKIETLRPPTTDHVLLPRTARRRAPRGVTLHWGELTPEEDRGGVTAPLRTVLDCAATLPFPEALAVADSALRIGLVEPDDLLDAAVRRRGAGRARVVRVATHADARAANPFESGLRGIVLDTGFAGFVPQLEIFTAERPVWVDLGDEDLRMVLEADSYTFHGTPDALARDCRRYDLLVRAGWTVLRFAWEHVSLEPGWVAETVIETARLRTPRTRNLQKSRE